MEYTWIELIVGFLGIAFLVGITRYFIWDYRKHIKKLFPDLDEEDN